MAPATPRPNSRPTLKRKGLKSRAKPTSQKATTTSSKLSVVGYVDQYGAKWVRVGFQGKWAFGRRADLVGEHTSFFKQLESQDVAILATSLQRIVRAKAKA